MFRRSFLILFIMVFPPSLCFGKTLPGDLKGLSFLKATATVPELGGGTEIIDLSFLDLLEGVVLVESTALENIAELSYEPGFEDLRTMIFLVFHRLNPDEFIASRSVSSLSTYLDPEMVGEFLGFIFKAQTKGVELRDLKKEIKERVLLPNLGRALMRNRKKWKFAKINSNTNKILSLFLENKEDKSLYLPFLALLWEKVKTKADLLAYYRGLHRVLGDDVFLPHGLSVLQDEATRNIWLLDDFKKEDLETEGALSSYEGKFYRAYTARSSFPLETQGYAKPIPGREDDFADCGATSLKNIFKLILDKNGEDYPSSLEGDYDLRILKKLNAHPEVLDFFNRFKTRQSQKSPEARDEWGRISCGKGIKYRLSIGDLPCEIDAGRENMFSLINELLFLPYQGVYVEVLKSLGINPMEKARDWDDLASKIQEARRKFWGAEAGSFSFPKNDDEEDEEDDGEDDGEDGNFSDLEIALGSFPEKFKWKFQTGHFYVEAIAKEKKGEVAPLESLEDLQELFGEKKGLNIFSLYHPKPEKAHILSKLENPFAKYHTFIKSDESSVDFIEGLRKEGSLVKEKGLARLYISIKEKRIRGNEDLLKRFVATAYPDSMGGLYKFYAEEGVPKKDFHLREFENALKKDGRALAERFLGLVFESLHSYLDPATGPLFILSGKNLNLDPETKDFLLSLNEESKEALEGGLLFNPSNESLFKLPYHKEIEFGSPILKKFYLKSSSFSADGSLLLSYQHFLVLLDSKTGEIIRTVGASERIGYSVMNPSGNFIMLASSEDTGIMEFNQERSKLTPYVAGLFGSFSPSESQFLVTSREGINLVQREGKETKILFPNMAAKQYGASSFSFDGKKIIVPVLEGEQNKIIIFDLEKNEEIFSMEKNLEGLEAAFLSPDETKILTFSNGGKNPTTIWDRATKQEIFSLSNDYKMPSFSPDSKKVVASSLRQVKIFDSSSGEQLFSFPEGASRNVSYYFTFFNHDGTKLVTSSIVGTAKIWDLCVLIPEHMGVACAP